MLSLLLLAAAHAHTAPVLGTTATELVGALSDGRSFALHQESATDWRCEGDGCAAERWHDEGRDAWSVYLSSEDGAVSWVADLWTDQLFANEGDGEAVAGAVTGAFAPVKGFDVDLVAYGVGTTPIGEFLATEDGWVQTEHRVIQRTWTEVGTDEWSVYLQDPATGEVCRLDLYLRAIPCSTLPRRSILAAFGEL